MRFAEKLEIARNMEADKLMDKLVEYGGFLEDKTLLETQREDIESSIDAIKTALKERM